MADDEVIIVTGASLVRLDNLLDAVAMYGDGHKPLEVLDKDHPIYDGPPISIRALIDLIPILNLTELFFPRYRDFAFEVGKNDASTANFALTEDRGLVAKALEVVTRRAFTKWVPGQVARSPSKLKGAFVHLDAIYTALHTWVSRHGNSSSDSDFDEKYFRKVLRAAIESDLDIWLYDDDYVGELYIEYLHRKTIDEALT